MWGCFEVFVDTIIVCSMTAFVIIVTGTWDSGLTSGTMTLTAFESEIGLIGRAIIAIATFLFAFTTGTGWYTYYDTLIRHGFTKDTPLRRALLACIKYGVAVPGWALVMLSYKYNVTTGAVWGVVDLGTGVPTFANMIVLIILCTKFFQLVKDYKARYMGIGEVDPEFYVWYEDKRKAAAK
jgi:AGCS family alanine or glycine:cation symporter